MLKGIKINNLVLIRVIYGEIFALHLVKKKAIVITID